MPWVRMGAYVVRRIGISVVQLLGVGFFRLHVDSLRAGQSNRDLLGPRATPRGSTRQRSLGSPALPEQFWLFLVTS